MQGTNSETTIKTIDTQQQQKLTIPNMFVFNLLIYTCYCLASEITTPYQELPVVGCFERRNNNKMPTTIPSNTQTPTTATTTMKIQLDHNDNEELAIA
jgi:hypothetical protein